MVTYQRLNGYFSADMPVQIPQPLHQDEHGTQPMFTQQLNSPQQSPFLRQLAFPLPAMQQQSVTTLLYTTPSQPVYTLPSRMVQRPRISSFAMPQQPVNPLPSAMSQRPGALAFAVPLRSEMLLVTIPVRTASVHNVPPVLGPRFVVVNSSHSLSTIPHGAVNGVLTWSTAQLVDGTGGIPAIGSNARSDHGIDGLEGVRMSFGADHVDLYCECAQFNRPGCPLTLLSETGVESSAGNTSFVDDPTANGRPRFEDRRFAAAPVTVTSGVLERALSGDRGPPRQNIVIASAGGHDDRDGDVARPTATVGPDDSGAPSPAQLSSLFKGGADDSAHPRSYPERVTAYRPTGRGDDRDLEATTVSDGSASPVLEVKMEPFCHLCTKIFSCTFLLDQHIADCATRRPHLCFYCGRGFRYPCLLKCHTRTHTGIRPFKCHVCQKSFIQRHMLNKHMQEKHNINLYGSGNRNQKVYVCEDCGHIAHEHNDLILHQKDKHPDGDPLLY